METDMILSDLCHEAIDRAANSHNEVEDAAAADFLLKRTTT
jgi:hypothetical protein